MYFIAFLYFLSTAFLMFLFWYRMKSNFSGQKQMNTEAWWWVAYAFGCVAITLVYLLWPKNEQPSDALNVAAVTAVIVGIISLWEDFISWWKTKMRKKKG